LEEFSQLVLDAAFSLGIAGHLVQVPPHDHDLAFAHGIGELDAGASLVHLGTAHAEQVVRAAGFLQVGHDPQPAVEGF
jgi:hypothetical protein